MSRILPNVSHGEHSLLWELVLDRKVPLQVERGFNVRVPQPDYGVGKGISRRGEDREALARR